MKISSLIKAMILAFSVLAISSITLSALSDYFADEMQRTYQQRIEYEEALMDMYLTTYRLFHLAHNYVVTSNPDYYERYFIVLNQNLFDSGMLRYLALDPTGEEIMLINQMYDNFTFFITRNEQALDIVHEDWEQAVHILHNAEYSEIFTNLDSLLNEVSAMMVRRTAVRLEHALGLRGFFDMLAILSVVALSIVAIAGALLIQRKMKPLKNLMQMVNDVSKGKINVNIDKSQIISDEIGLLTLDIIGLVEVLKSIVEDLIKMEHEFNAKGDFEHRVDVSKYQNSFREMIEGVHAIIDDQMKDINGVLNVIGKVGDGDFNIIIEDMPGKKAIMPQMLRTVIDNLKNVTVEVNEMIEATVDKGDLNFQVNADKYKGDWRKIMIGLNDIVKAVDAPLRVLKTSLDEMKAGNFELAELDRKVAEMGLEPDANKYKGIFKDSILAIDGSMIEIYSYIKELDGILTQMAGGSLRSKIEREYVGDFATIKNSINNINSTLNKTMSEISTVSDQVLLRAQQVSNSAFDLSNGAQEQASSVQELNATIDVINQQTKQNAENALTANELSNKSTTNAQEGNNAMKQMVEAMAQIKESYNNISQIVKTIQDIAFQTNLLALNASVEAARAGEHGKGFSVVADEVRSLAGRSQTAASETTDLIRDSVDRVESGSNIAEMTAESLNAIVAGADEVLEIISGISAASKEQAEAIANVTIGLAQISEVVQNNSAVSEETAAASEELNSQAGVLRQLVSFFKL